MNGSNEGNSLESALRSVRVLRERLWNDPHRPRYHLMPPDGFFNDANGTIYWKGRYHVFYLGRMPNPDPGESTEYDWLPVLEHSSSDDLVHWIYHPPAIVPAFDGTTPRGIYSGDAIENAPIPTLIYHVPGQGTCIATSNDDNLVKWSPLPDNPVIPVPDETQRQQDDSSEDADVANPAKDYCVFDPCAWYEDGVYYALLGNKNLRPGYEGDCTSLFRSKDLVHWDYLHPFYRSDRKWTDEVEDCACPDFFPIGDRHMLLMHTHRPNFQCQYYLGRYENHTFYPEDHGRMNWHGGALSGPETLLDDNGRRIFFGWIRETNRLAEGRNWDDCFATGWGSVMSLPRVFSLDDGGKLLIDPVPELQALRQNHRRWDAVALEADEEKILPEVKGDCLEIAVVVDPEDAKRLEVKVRCSPDGKEQTTIAYDHQKKLIGIGTNDSDDHSQEAPFYLAGGEPLEMRIFLDRSVLEVFVNHRQCITHRTYPRRGDSFGIRFFASGAKAQVRSVDIWEMQPVC
jgi:beta-fructofuranosidase